MIRLQNIHKVFNTASGPVTVLNDISLEILPGEIFGIIGQSGAGKSTLIRSINLLEHPSSGKIIVDGNELTALPARALRLAREHIGMIFQNFNLLSRKTVFENIALPLVLNGLDEASIEEAITPLLELVGLTQKRNAYPRELSGGQKQRVAIARALVHKPRVLVCDECTSALDPKTTESILNLLQSLQKNLNLTILLITHEMDVIKRLCDRVAILDHGVIVEQQEVREFFRNPQTEIAKNLIQSTLKHEIPEVITQNLQKEALANHDPIWRIWFAGKSSAEPLLSHCVQQFLVNWNILQANIEYIHGEATGIMIVAVQGTPENIERAERFFLQRDIHIETIGYVPRIIYASV